MAKTVATKTETTTETVVTKTVTKTYEDGVLDGAQATLSKVVAYMDEFIETNKGVGYIHTLETIRETINNINN
jgi:hypothetical protein